LLKIRLQRTGRKRQPFYRVAVVEHSTSTQGKFIEKLGHYNPLIKPWSLEVDEAKILEWIKKGAKPSSTLARLLKAQGVKGMEPYIKEMKDRKKKKEEEKKEEAPKTEAAEGEAPAEAEAPAEEKPEEAPAEAEATAEEKPEEAPAEEAPAEEKPAKEEEPKEEETPAEEAPTEEPKEEEPKEEEAPEEEK
jgi:small subunit ribosomal protein S16